MAALIIITVNVKTKEKLKVPALAGKLYLEEHNRLMNLGLKVDIEKANLVEYPYGYILAQNIPPGKIVKEGTHFVLLINESQSVVPVPLLVGASESIALKLLANIPVGKTSYPLTMGTITRIPNDKPAGEILAQYPPPSTTVIPLTPVSALVSEGPEKFKTGFLLPDLKGVHIEIIKKLSYDLQIPVKIVPVKTYDYWKNGDVAGVEFGGNGIFINPAVKNEGFWTVLVDRYTTPDDKIYPNEVAWINFQTSDLKGKAVTVYEKTNTNLKNPAYIIMDDVWPLYFLNDIKVAVWDGYHSYDDIVANPQNNKGSKTMSEKNEEVLRIQPDFERNVRAVKL